MDDSGRQNRNYGEHKQMVKDNEINLLDYLRVIFKYRRVVLLICAVAVTVTVIVSFLLPKIYSASASIVPPIDILRTESNLAGGLGVGKGSMLGQIIDVTSIVDMYVGILESRAVVDVIIDKFDLMDVYGEKEYISNVRAKLRDNTIIGISDGGIVTITVEDRNPERAADMANTYVEELDQQNKRLSSGQATSKRIFLENRLKEIEQELSNIENIPAREAQIKEMLYQLLCREYELAKIEEAKSMPTIQVLDEAVAPEKKCKPKRKFMVAISATVSLFSAVFIAFALEYFARIKWVLQSERQKDITSEERRDGDEIGDFDQLQSRRQITAAQRKKRVQDNEVHAQRE